MKNITRLLLAACTVAMIAAAGVASAAEPGPEQAAATVAAGRPDGASRGQLFWESDRSALLALLNSDAATLQAGIDAGKTLAQIAADHGVSAQAVVNLLAVQMADRIDDGVATGWLPADKAAELKADLALRAERMVNAAPGGPRIDLSPLVALLGIDEQTLKDEFRSGKSLLAVAAAHGVDRQAVIDLCTRLVSERLDAEVEAGRLTMVKAAVMKARMAVNAERLLDINPLQGVPGGTNK